MGFGRVFLVLVGLFLVIFGYSSSADSVSCYSDVHLVADNTILNELENNHYSVYLQNDSSRTFYIDDVYVSSSSSYLSTSYSGRESDSVASGSSTRIFIDLSANSIQGDRDVSVTVRVNGHFSNGQSCSSSQIQDYFTVAIKEDDQSNGNCTQIRVFSNDFVVPEESTTYKSITVSNDSDYDFIIDSADAGDSNPYFSVTKDSLSSNRINANSDLDFRVRIDSSSVSSEQRGTAFAKISGHFENGRNCSSSNIGEKDFIVTVQNSGIGNCGSISIDSETISVNESETGYNYFPIRNNSNRAFSIDEVQITETAVITAKASVLMILQSLQIQAEEYK